ncbi:winged helix-turn-helix domain-containing protein [Streptomyces sp. L7]
MFLAHPRQVLTREQILKAVWGFDFRAVLQLPRRVRDVPPPQDRGGGEPRLVHTVRGVGYVLRQGGAE